MFGGSTLLTTKQIDIGSTPVTVNPNEGFVTITKSAALNIDLSRYIVSMHANEGFMDMEKIFPQGTVKAALITTHGRKVELDKASGQWAGIQRTLNLRPERGIPTGVE